MTTPFVPRVWTDGSTADTGLLTAARGPNRWEYALADLADRRADLADQINAVAAAVAERRLTQVRTGPSDQRGTPSKGALYWDVDLDRLLVGNGARWEGADGEALPGPGGGTTAAPTGLDATQTGPGEATITWTPAPGADHYELRESQFPTGWTGSTNLTGTSYLVPGLAQRVYEFWVVAVDASGNVSGDSNHVLIDITTSTPGGGGGGASTPWGILGLGPAGGGYWDIGIGYPSGHVNTPYSQLAAGFTATPYFLPTTDLTGVVFRAVMNGGLTSSAAGGPRAELREYANATGTKAAWVAATGTHVLEYTFRLEHLQPKRPYCIVGQLHDASNDVLSVRIRGASLTGTGGTNVEAWILSKRNTTNLVTGYTLGQDVKIRLEFTAGVLKIYVNGTLKITDSTSFKSKTAEEMYWKLGAYADSSTAEFGESASEYCQVRIIGAITCTHSATSGGGSSGGSGSSPEVVQEKAFEITSTAENSTVAWWEQYDYIADIKDGRGYTAGLVGFTSATADMEALVKQYTVEKPGNTLAPWIPNLERCTAYGDTVADANYGVNGGGASTKAATELGQAFINAWKAAANNDPTFRKVQRDFRNNMYWLPAYNAAVADGLGPLGIAIYYDTSVNHGPGKKNSNDGSFDDIRSRTTGTKPSAGGNETTWLNNFITRRSAVLTTWGDNPSDGRINMWKGLITAGKLTLAVPVTWKVYGDTFTMTADPTPRTD